ncbi:DMT family transporter [Saccharopolyspora sp. CA-218241]|uniref:DMT family transporter n=1 Tax=Saccharopolyspora sp. CA-218241 TaxID=3240027 RepID=UPI003D99330A
MNARALGMIGAAVVGVLLAAQARLNGALGAELGDGVIAALISFGGGLAVLLPAAVLHPAGRRGARRLVAEVRGSGGLRAWHCLGGVCGAYLVITQGVAAGGLGVALFTVSVVAGQVTSGLVVDRFGLGPAGPQPVTVLRLVGAALAVFAVLIAVSAQLGDAQVSWLVLLPGLAGLGLGWQAAVNGRVQQVASTLTAATLNFGVGTLALVLASAAVLVLRGAPERFPTEPWLYAGGLIGIVVIVGNVALVRFTGVLVLSLGLIAGQLLGALLLDVLVPVPGSVVVPSTVFGVLLTLLAVGVAAVPDRRSRPDPGLPR